MENANYNAGGTGANLFAGGAQAGQAASQVIHGVEHSALIKQHQCRIVCHLVNCNCNLSSPVKCY